VTLIFILTVSAVFGQGEKERLAEIAQTRESEKQRLVQITLDSAIMLLGAEEYEAADKKFKYVLKNIKSVPSDLAYYFGENSYHLGLAKQSVDWLNKYIQLKGTTGRFSNDAILYLKKAEAALVVAKSEETKEASEILSRDYDIDCGPTGKVVCPVCSGSTVVVKRTYLGETYKTCAYCNRLGYLTCEEYNMLLRGELTPK